MGTSVSRRAAGGSTLGERLRFRFDDYMSRGSRSILLALLSVSVFVFSTVAIARLVAVQAFGGEGDIERGAGLARQVYLVFLQTTDPGNMAQDIESRPWAKTFAVIAGLLGIVFLSSLIAYITTALDERLRQLRKGHSRVIVTDHTLILGWNQRIFDVLHELVLANESENSPSIVILADVDKEQMDDEVALRLPDSRGTRIITRSGSEHSALDLSIVAVAHAKSIIVLGDHDASDHRSTYRDSDFAVLKALLAVTAALPDGRDTPIVAELFRPDHREIASALEGPTILAVDSDDVLAKILVQTSRSVGLSVVYEELLSFDGAEIYFFDADWPSDVTFRDIGFHLPDGVPVGIARDGEIMINPDPLDLLRSDDELIVIATDDSALRVATSPVAPLRAPSALGTVGILNVERELIIGWNPKGGVILDEYADYVADGSQIDIVLRSQDDSALHEIAALADEIDGMTIRIRAGDVFSSFGLAALEPDGYDNVIILSEPNEDRDAGDTETLGILLLLRHVIGTPAADRSNRTKLIAEILDSGSRDLVRQAGVRDFIISNRFTSMLLAQLSEEPRMIDVYAQLFREDGSEIYLKPLERYFAATPSEPLTFADLMSVASARSEVAIGVKLAGLELDALRNFGIELDPDKCSSYLPEDIDRLIVLAEDER